MSKWRPIDSAPKEIVYQDVTPFGPKEDPLIHEYGPHILAYPVSGGRAGVVRWWQSNKVEPNGRRPSNFLGDCGNAYRPTHWMPLPKAPAP